MSTYSNRLQPALQNLQLYVVRLFRPRKSLVKPVTQQKTCNYNVVRFFRPRSSCTTHISADVRRITLNALCMTISGGRTKQLDILQVFCRVTGFTSDFLSCIVVEHILLFHGALQLSPCPMMEHLSLCCCRLASIQNFIRSIWPLSFCPKTGLSDTHIMINISFKFVSYDE